MGGLGFILGGALQGAGKGLAMQGQERAQAAASDLEFRRRMALENLRNENQSARMREQADLNDRNDARATSRKTDASIVTDNARTGNDVKLEGVRASNQQALARLNSQLNMSEFEKNQAVELQNDLTKAGQKAAKFEVTADGRMVAYSETGQVLRASPPGTFNPSGSSDTTGLGSIIEQARAGKNPPAAPARAAAPAPAPAETGGRGGTKPPADKSYSMADAKATAKKHGVSLDEVHRRMRAAGYKLTSE